MKITVTTPTGHIGSKLSNLLFDRGAEVTVIARDPAKVKELAGRGAHLVAGEHSDPAVVKRAIEGADSLFWLIPPNYTTKDPRGEYRKFADAAATAISQFPQIKFVLLSSMGANRTEGTGPIKGSHDLRRSFALGRKTSPSCGQTLHGERSFITAHHHQRRQYLLCRARVGNYATDCHGGHRGHFRRRAIGGT